MGIEMQGAFQPNEMVRFDAAASVGFWKYLDNVSGQYRPDDTSQATIDFDFYLKDLKVADAPQRQLALTTSFFPTEGLTLSEVGKFYA
jgi:hypothetical protein